MEKGIKLKSAEFEELNSFPEQTEYNQVQKKASENNSDNYLTKLLKLLPSEVTAVYLFIDGIVKGSGKDTLFLNWIIFICLLLINVIYLNKYITTSNVKIKMFQIGFSSIGFIIWGYFIGGPFKFISWYDIIYGSVSIPIYTLLIPLIFNKKMVE
jgi:hypothetical protein